jgi:hypothetical protein
MTEKYKAQKGTLVYDLNAVDNLPRYAEHDLPTNKPSARDIDKIALKTEVFNVWRENNPLVERVLEKETTFTTEFDNLVGQYGHGALWCGYTLPDDIRAKVYDLERCIGQIIGGIEEKLKDFSHSPPLSENPISSIISNPLVSGIGMGGFFSGIAYLAGGRGEPLCLVEEK